MKMVHAIIRREKLSDVKDALHAIECPGMMVWEIIGHGKQHGSLEQFQGFPYRIELMPKVKIEIIAQDPEVKMIVDTILRAAGTQKVGDGKIFISPIEDAIRIRTGERGEGVVS